MKKNLIPIKKNDIITLEIVDMTTEGLGVGKHEGFAVFVPQTAAGDIISVKILKVLKNHAYGKAETLLTPSSERISPDCPSFSQCGGCCYRHISYEAELFHKEKRVKDALSRIGGFSSFPINPIQKADHRNHYRNKALLPLGLNRENSMSVGFYALHSHRIVECDSCLLQPASFERIIDVFRAWQSRYQVSVYDEYTHHGLLRRLYLRHAESTGEIMVCVVINGQSLPFQQELVDAFTSTDNNIKSIVINKHTKKTNSILGTENQTIYGKDTIRDILCGLSFDISPLSFYQVNRLQAERLYQKAAEYANLSGNETVIDLYCGTGTIGLSMADKIKKLIGVEIIPDAIENAKKNAVLNNILNAEFLCADATKAAHMLAKRNEKADVLILDPPRKGCSQDLLQILPKFGAEKIVYISCDPATLARDLRVLSENDYQPVEVTTFDLFPCTAHVETVVLMSRKDS
jgi:23S rRNA (uracil-5-)-methyltransferase RumA